MKSPTIPRKDKMEGPDVLVVLAAGINTDRDEDFFKDFKEELKDRYAAEGKSVRIVEVYPLGEAKATPLGLQVLKVGLRMQRGTGGKEVSDAVLRYRDGSRSIVLIGHSGGAQAVGDALPELESKGVHISHVVQIGAPAHMVNRNYAHKVTRVQAKSDFVSNRVTFGAEVCSDGINPIGGLFSSILRMFKNRMPRIRYADINTQGQTFGGHSAYFTRSLRNAGGVDNVTATVNAFWDKIK